MDQAEQDLREQTEALIEPGEIELRGLIVRTDVPNSEEPELNRVTLEIGDAISEHATTDADTYVYSGTDDPEFGLNQHQGRTIEGEEFVWECQQLLRDGTFDVVFYYEDSADTEAILTDLQEEGYDVEDVESP
ncbi:hypothetical protein HLRTI_000928 [Halorhabdus tiamatea SARL4B]|uniref:Uncharacterized protein n=1 Tax=Halorhabdus tiamatea SARL4B TaxID=1033806 RepID=F7PIF7_9EURY|nr:DUF5778 family protein [Halorhabdus tiamatea]ERJ07070.1 hypothetical protein HLRTI_000928 [Halorhabdus tiamatea SARL4B]CCQ34835.1 conserved hypothetical protein [Halorhabdus tiamatea SARL4B]